jgi:hypothetical protein
MDLRTAVVKTTAKISEFNDDFCDMRCPHLYGMFDRCGLYGQLNHEFKLHLFRRADDCLADFPEKQASKDE